MLPAIRTASALLFALIFVGSVLCADQNFANWLYFDGAAIRAGRQPWSPLSATFMHTPAGVGFGVVTASLLVQWVYGGALEAYWGTWRYFGFVCACAAIGWMALVITAFAAPHLSGARIGGAVIIDLVTLTAFGVTFSRRQLRVLGSAEFPGWVAALLGVVVVGSLTVRADPPWQLGIAGGAAVLAALAWTARPWRRSAKSGKISASNGRKPHLKVVYSADDLLN